MANKNINDLPTATSLNAGDKLEILQGGTNKQIDSSLLVSQSTPLGLIQIIDLDGDFFTDLATASAYIRTMWVAPPTITNESFDSGVYYFTVPSNTIIEGFFLTDTVGGLPNNASVIDPLGLLTEFQSGACFVLNTGNHILGNCSFADTDFYQFSGNVFIKNIVDIFTSLGNSFAEFSSGKFIIEGNIGPLETAQYTPFFRNSTSTIFVNAGKYTSNSGTIQGDLQTAITNGCNVQFDGINLATVNDIPSSIQYFNPLDYGAVIDGTTDDATAIQNTFNASYAATGNYNVIFPAGVYKVNTPILLDMPTANINIKGNHAELKAGITTSSNAMIFIRQAADVNIENLKFNFNAQALTYYGILLGESTNKTVGALRIVNCDFYNFGMESANGISIRNTPKINGVSGAYNKPSALIEGCNFYNINSLAPTLNYNNTTSYYGVGIYAGDSSDYMRVSNCSFNYVRVGIWCVNGANMDITGCNFLAIYSKIGASYAYGAIYVPNTGFGGNNGKVNVVACKFNHNFGYSIYYSYAGTERPLTVSSCHFIANCATGIYITHTSSVTAHHKIHDNYFERTSQALTGAMPNQPFGASLLPFIYLNNQLYCSVKNNKFLNDGTYGVITAGVSDYTTVLLNTVTNITGQHSLVGSNNVIETGTANLVYSDSPTLTGTPLAPNAALFDATTQIPTTKWVRDNAGGCLYRNSTGTPVTGTTANTLVDSVLLPANTMEPGWDLYNELNVNKNLDNGTFTVRVYYNTTNLLDGSQVLLATYTSTAAINQISFTRSFGIISLTETQLLIPQSTSAAGDFIASSNSVVTTLNIDWTQNLYIIWAIQNSSAADTTVISRNKLWKK